MRKQTDTMVSSPEISFIDAKLEEIDLPTLLTICVDLLAVCARRAAKLDPAVGQ